MRTWKEVIKEATAAEIRRAGEAALRDERKKNKEEKTTKGKSSYQDYLEKQLAFKKDKYEAQKKAQIERMKEKNVQGPLDQAKASLKGIQTQTISDKDKEGTAYSKLMGNVGSTAVGVGGAVFHGIRALAARRKAETKAKEKQQEKRERKAAGRPPGKTEKKENPSPEAPTAKKEKSQEQPKLLVPSTKRLPPSGGTGGRGAKKQTLGQRARNNPAIKAGLIAQRMESYSNWREELLIEVDEKDKGKKEKIINVMKGKNTIIINPDEKKVNEALDEWHPDPEKDRRLGGPGPNQRAREDRPSSKKLKPGESYYEYAKRQRLKEEGPVLSVGRGEKLPVSQGAGLTAKGRARYNRETGSNLQAPVTGDVKPGSKSAQRRKNFCSRSRSWKGERGLAARRRWKC